MSIRTDVLLAKAIGEVRQLRRLLKQGPPGPPPRLGLDWKEETHRWVRPGENAMGGYDPDSDPDYWDPELAEEATPDVYELGGIVDDDEFYDVVEGIDLRTMGRQELEALGDLIADRAGHHEQARAHQLRNRIHGVLNPRDARGL